MKMEITATDSGRLPLSPGERMMLLGGYGWDAIFGQHFRPNAQKLGSAFQINQLIPNINVNLPQ